MTIAKVIHKTLRNDSYFETEFSSFNCSQLNFNEFLQELMVKARHITRGLHAPKSSQTHNLVNYRAPRRVYTADMWNIPDIVLIVSIYIILLLFPALNKLSFYHRNCRYSLLDVGEHDTRLVRWTTRAVQHRNHQRSVVGLCYHDDRWVWWCCPENKTRSGIFGFMGLRRTSILWNSHLVHNNGNYNVDYK